MKAHQTDFFSSEALIDAGEGLESRTAYRHLLEQLVGEWKPQGTLENLLVERIAICIWRLRRALRAEVGEIRKRLDTVTTDEMIKLRDDFDNRRHFLRYRIGESNPIASHYRLRALEEVKTAVEAEGSLSQESLRLLVEHFGDDEAVEFCWGLSLIATQRESLQEKDPVLYADIPPPEKCQEGILAVLTDIQEVLTLLLEGMEERQELHRQATEKSYALPTLGAQNQILSYEAQVHKQLDETIRELERLQAKRKPSRSFASIRWKRGSA